MRGAGKAVPKERGGSRKGGIWESAARILTNYDSGRIGNFIVEPPFVLAMRQAGPWLSGTACSFLKGGIGALEPGKTAGTCEHLQGGEYNLCEDVISLPSLPLTAVFQEYVAPRGRLCFNAGQCEALWRKPLWWSPFRRLHGGLCQEEPHYRQTACTGLDVSDL